MCRIISQAIFLAFCTYLDRCSNFEFEAILCTGVSVSKCTWVGGVDTYEAVADSRSWEVFANKSADIHDLCNSFITTPSSVHIYKRVHAVPDYKKRSYKKH